MFGDQLNDFQPSSIRMSGKNPPHLHRLMALRVKGTVKSAVASPVTTAPAEARWVALALTVALPGTSWLEMAVADIALLFKHASL